MVAYVLPIALGSELTRKQLNAILADIDARLPLIGVGTPEGHVAAVKGSLYRRTDGGAGTSLYVKESGTGNTGWAGK